MNKIGAITAVARNLGDLITDTTPSAVTGSTIDATKLIHPISEALRGKACYIYGAGAAAGQHRIVGSFAPANNRLMFDEVFTTTPSTNSQFLLFDHFDKDDYDNALNRMIGYARLTHLEEKVATLALVATQYEYPVPSGFDYIRTLRLVPSGYTDYGADDEVDRIFELPPRYWRIEPNALGTFVVVFDPRRIDLDNFDEEWVNVIGQVKPDISATDNATIPQALEEYLISGASMLLSAQRIAENQEWRIKFGLFRDLTKDLETYIHRQRYGKRVGA